MPEIQFQQILNEPGCLLPLPSRDAVRSAGCVVVRQVVPESDILALRSDLEDYLAQNQGVTGFPEHDPQVLEVYWSRAQVRTQ